MVIAYDVVDDRRRNRICKMLKNHGAHVQFSVFECELRQKDFEALENKITRLINPREDNLRFYFLDQAAISRIKEIGKPHTNYPKRNTRFLIL